MNGISAQSARAEGMVFIHSATSVLLPHIEWALGRLLGGPVGLQWTPQPLRPGHFRSELAWNSDPSFGSVASSELLGWGSIAFEIVQDEVAGSVGWRWSYTPSLGLFQGQIDSFGNVLVNEHKIMALAELAGSTNADLRTQLRLAVGEPWERELEPLRRAAEGSPVVWLKSVAN
jgi:hypothetical protein